MVPPRASGKMSILRNGGSGRPRNLVVALDMGGMYRLATSKSTSTAPPSSPPSAPHPAPTPQPPCALYAKSGYLPIPSPHPSCVRNSTLSVSVPGRACAATAGEDGCWLPPVHATTTARRWCRKDCGMAGGAWSPRIVCEFLQGLDAQRGGSDTTCCGSHWKWARPYCVERWRDKQAILPLTLEVAMASVGHRLIAFRFVATCFFLPFFFRGQEFGMSCHFQITQAIAFCSQDEQAVFFFMRSMGLNEWPNIATGRICTAVANSHPFIVGLGLNEWVIPHLLLGQCFT
jgi:hypothetical protein